MVRHRLVWAGAVCASLAWNATCEAVGVEFTFTMWNGSGVAWRGVEVEIVRPPVTVPLSDAAFQATRFMIDPPSIENAVLGDAAASFVMIPGHDDKMIHVLFSEGFRVDLGGSVRFSVMVDLPKGANVAFRRTPIEAPAPGVGALGALAIAVVGTRRRRACGSR